MVERGDVMSFDYSRLAGKIKEKFGSQMNFAKAMKLSERSISLKMNNKLPWKQTEMLKACKLLDIDVKKVPTYFFTT
jgi:hypothetical protein